MYSYHNAVTLYLSISNDISNGLFVRTARSIPRLLKHTRTIVTFSTNDKVAFIWKLCCYINCRKKTSQYGLRHTLAKHHNLSSCYLSWLPQNITLSIKNIIGGRIHSQTLANHPFRKYMYGFRTTCLVLPLNRYNDGVPKSLTIGSANRQIYTDESEFEMIVCKVCVNEFQNS